MITIIQRSIRLIQEKNILPVNDSSTGANFLPIGETLNEAG